MSKPVDANPRVDACGLEDLAQHLVDVLGPGSPGADLKHGVFGFVPREPRVVGLKPFENVGRQVEHPALPCLRRPFGGVADLDAAGREVDPAPAHLEQLAQPLPASGSDIAQSNSPPSPAAILISGIIFLLS